MPAITLHEVGMITFSVAIRFGIRAVHNGPYVSTNISDRVWSWHRLVGFDSWLEMIKNSSSIGRAFAPTCRRSRDECVHYACGFM